LKAKRELQEGKNHFKEFTNLHFLPLNYQGNNKREETKKIIAI
jgi:hypothetical protein